jgi:putative inorganic carbon (hco3(-)) transporter
MPRYPDIPIPRSEIADRVSRLSLPPLIAVIAVTVASLAASSSLFLIAGVCAGLVVVAVLRFEWFIYTQIFLLPWYPFLDTGVLLRDVSLPLRFLLFVGVWLIRKHQGKSVKQWFFGSRLKKGVIIFAAISTLSLVLSALGPNIAAVRSLVRLFSYLALFFGIAGWIETKEQIVKIIKVVLTSTIFVSLFAFYQVLAQDYTDLYFQIYPSQVEALDPWSGRATSFLFHFNSLAGYLNLVLPFSLACMVLAKESSVRYLALAAHTLACATLYFTASRGGFIAYGGMVLVAIWFFKPRVAALSRVLLTGVLSLVIVLALQPPSSGSRLQDVDEFTSMSRKALWGTAAILFLQHPVLGVGYGNYRSLYSDYLPGIGPNELDAHNIYLQFLAETGIIGFAAFFLMLAAFARIATRLAKNIDPVYRMVGIGVGGALTATLIHGGVDYLFNVSPQFGALFWLIMALGVVASEQSAKLVSLSRSRPFSVDVVPNDDFGKTGGGENPTI